MSYKAPTPGRFDARQNTTDYVHPQETNLLSIERAMQYNNAGEPVVRTHVDGITLEGNVIVDAVKIWDGLHYVQLEQPNNDGEAGGWAISTENYNMVYNGTAWDRMRGNINDGVLVKLSNGTIAVTQSTSPWVITGNANVKVDGNVSGITTLPAITGNVGVSGNVSITQLPALGNVSITQMPAIHGNVNVDNFNGNVRITDMPGVTGNVHVYGNVDVDHLPNVTIGTMPGVTGNIHIYGNIGGSDQPITVNQGTDPWSVTGNVTVVQDADTPSLVKYINTPNNLQMDMAQRLRVSPNSQSWWYAPTVDKDGDLRYIESATGTNAGSIFVQNLSSINMSSGTASNGSFTRISRRRHKMRPGVSMTAAFSVNWNGFVPDGNVTKRVGVFTNFNGVFFEMTGDLQAVIRRRLTDGTLVEKRIARADFSIDKLDGTGETGYDLRPIVANTSAITAYVSKSSVAIAGDGTVYQVVFTVSDPSQFYVSQKGRITGVSPSTFNGTVMVTAINGSNVTFVYNIDPGVYSSLSSAKFDHTNLHNQYVFGFDFNGNRATSVRFFIDGPLGRVAIHQEDFGGELSSPFSNAPAISTRYEIFNTGAPSRIPNLTCSSEVINVEADVELNPGFGVATNNTPVVYAKGGTATYPVLGIALRAGEPYQRADLQLQSLTFADIANINQQNSGVFYWRLVLNPTLGGTVPASSNIGKATRYWKYTNETTVSGGTDLLSGYASSTQQFDVRAALNFINLGSNIAYDDSDKVVLVVQQLVGGTSDAQLVATINFIESL